MKRLFISIASVLVAVSSFAQLSVGVRGGYGAFGVQFEPPSLNGNQENLFEPNFGFVAVFNDKNNAGIQLEVNYAVKGWREMDEDIEDSEYKREVSYLEIPVMSHVELGRGWFRIIGTLGPYIAFKQSEKSHSKNYDAVIGYNTYDVYNQKIRDIDFGNKVGLGFRVNIGKYVSAFADVRYDLQIAGGQNIFKDHPNGIQTSRYKELGGSVGIMFNILPQRTTVVKEYYVPKEGLDYEP